MSRFTEYELKLGANHLWKMYGDAREVAWLEGIFDWLTVYHMRAGRLAPFTGGMKASGLALKYPEQLLLIEDALDLQMPHAPRPGDGALEALGMGMPEVTPMETGPPPAPAIAAGEPCRGGGKRVPAPQTNLARVDSGAGGLPLRG